MKEGAKILYKIPNLLFTNPWYVLRYVIRNFRSKKFLITFPDKICKELL
jgi:hypothetical protein